MTAAEVYKIKARDELVRLYAGGDWQVFNALPDKQKSVKLALFYVEEIHNKSGFIISDEDIEWGVVDGSNDLGCDFISRSEGQVTIIQTKYRKSSFSEDTAAVNYFRSVLVRLRNKALKPNKNVKEIIDEIDWNRDAFELFFITTGKIDPQSQAFVISQQPPEYPADTVDLDERCEWHYIDESELNIQFRSARDLHKGGQGQKIDLYAVGPKGRRGTDAVLEVRAGAYSSFIMTLDARQIVRAYKTLGQDALFSLNIRNYIGNTSTNKAIIKTAEEEPSEFFMYNNGISCLATNLSLFDDHIEVTGLQVINGAQTVKTLVHVSKIIEQMDGKKHLWDQHVPLILVRITEVPEGYGSTIRARERITQYNNTQNAIKISDFRSNDQIQANLKEQFSQINRFGKKVVYLAKRTDRVPGNTEVIRLEEYSKAVYTFLFDFLAFSGSSSFLFDDGISGGYVRVFGNGDKLWESMPTNEFRLRSAIYWISSEIYSHLRATRGEEIDVDARAALERKWPVLFAFSRAATFIYGDDDWKNQISKLYKGDWKIGQDKKGEVFLLIYNYAKSGVIMAYKNAKKYNKDFVHRNWMRGRGTPEEINEALTLYILPNAKASVPSIPQ